MYCENCGSVLEDGVKFCGECGHPVRSSQNPDISMQGTPPTGGPAPVSETQQIPISDASQQPAPQGFQQYGAPAQQGQGNAPVYGAAAGPESYGRPPQGGKKKTGLIIGIIVAVVVVLGVAGGLAWWFIGQQGSSPSSSVASSSSTSSSSSGSTAPSSSSASSSSKSSSSSSSVTTPTIEGEWKAVRAEYDNGTVYDEELFAKGEQEGAVYKMIFASDGTVSIVSTANDSDSTSATWTPTNATSGHIYINSFVDDYEIVDGRLIITEDGSKLYFVKI